MNRVERYVYFFLTYECAKRTWARTRACIRIWYFQIIRVYITYICILYTYIYIKKITTRVTFADIVIVSLKKKKKKTGLSYCMLYTYGCILTFRPICRARKLTEEREEVGCEKGCLCFIDGAWETKEDVEFEKRIVGRHPSIQARGRSKSRWKIFEKWGW